MNAGRLVPMLVLLGGVGATVANIDRIVGAVTDKAKTLLTGFELGNIRDELLSHVSRGGAIPGIDDEEVTLVDFLRENFQGRSGANRDPSEDLWQHPYSLETADEENRYLLSSDGPNGLPDCCVNLQAMIRAVETQAGGASDEAGTAPAHSKNRCDDICVPVTLVTRGDDRDSPFRPLR